MWLFGFLLIAVVCAAKCTEADISVEAAFQGRCGHGSPCEQLCYELHDGMYECDCSEGFELNRNGYSCQEINSTSTDDNASNGEEDVLYQRGASFSAKLDISDLHISMKSFDDDDDEADVGGSESKHSAGGTRQSIAQIGPSPNANANSILVDDELARRKANRNWKLEPSSKQSANTNAARAARVKPSRKEKSIQNDGLPALVTAFGRNGVRRDQPPKTSASGSERRKVDATSAGRKGSPGAAGAVDGTIGRSNMPPASDMEISGISLHSPPAPGGRWQRADAPETATSAASAALLAVDDDDDDDDGGDAYALYRYSQPCTLDCGSEGTCYIVTEGSSTAMRCLCAFGKIGLRCEEDVKVNTPRFSKHSWVAFPALRGAYKHVQLHVEFRPESFDGILLLTGERDDLTGDFMALLLHQGFVEFWFDCGSGMGRVKSEETIVLNQWNTITIYRHRWDAWLVLNQGNRVQGRSKGLFSRITFREPVFLGGYGNITGLDRKLPVSTGFTGCIRKFVANDHDYNFLQGPLGDVSHGFDIQECITDRCSRYPCQHGGKCLPSDDGAICLCPLGFGGDLCEMRLDLQVPSFNGSSYLRYAPLGDSCIIWFELKIIIKPLLEDGLLLYSGHHEYGDYISLCLNMGYVEFTYDLGSGPATVRSEFPLTMGQWHTIKVSRTSRLAVLKIDQLPEVMTVSPNGFWHLSLPHSLYLGGIHNVHTLPTSLRDKGSFAGCIQKVDINDRTIAIISEALGGSNVENCPHACVARPCGPLAKCVPNLDTYECQCNPQNRQCNKAEELPSEVIEKQQRLLKRKQQEQSQSQQAVSPFSPAPAAAAASEPTQPLTTLLGTSISTTQAPPEDSTLPHDNNPADVGDGSSEESDEGYNDYYQNDSGDDDDDGDDGGGDNYGATGTGSSGSDYNQPPGGGTQRSRHQSAAGEIKSAPPASPAGNEADKQSTGNGAEQAAIATTTTPSMTASTVANEKIIVWIDRQKSKDPFSMQSNDYADYGGGEILMENGEVAGEERRQQDDAKKDDIFDDRGTGEVYEPPSATGKMVVNDRKMMSPANDDDTLLDVDDDDGDDDDDDDDDGNDTTRETRRPQVDVSEKSSGTHQKTEDRAKTRRPETSGKEDEPSSSYHDDNDDSNSTDEPPPTAGVAYDGDGYGKDYDQHGDRIPYRPDFLLHRKGSWRSRPDRRHRGQTDRPAAQDEPEIDETLIEEMNRIMKNHNDNDNDADETLDSSFWGVAADGFGDSQRDFELETDDDAEAETHSDDDSADEGDQHHHHPHHAHQHHDHHEQRAPSHHRRRNGVEEEQTQHQEQDPSGGHAEHRQEQRQQQQQQQQQQPQDDPRTDEDDILRSIKYKNKYFRKYQGACFTGTDSYFHYSDAETMRRVISYEIDLNLRFKTHSANGLILWTGRHSALEGDDFLSLGIENGYLHLRYNLGSGEINIKYNSTKVSDGLWHRVRALRNSQDGTLKVDGGKPITRRSPGKLRQLNTDTGLYVGKW
uniref:Pikachurin n=1 Tax=Anopheles dirus TaxID=7168 RepID=A0A1Y9H1Y6_9DIPT